MGNDNTIQETQFIFRRLEEALQLFGKEVSGYFWLAVLIPVLLLAAVYVVWMYVRDGRSVGWQWATFLGALRLAVYGILAWVFLLPADQIWEKSEIHSRVSGLVDVSGSMGSKDDLPTDTLPADRLQSRLDKVVAFLTDPRVAFLKRLQEKNPVYLHRFGMRADEDARVFAGGAVEWSKDKWAEWLKPDPKLAMPDNLNKDEQDAFRKKLDLHQQLVGGTNLGDSLLTVLKRESNHMLQGIVVFSDGRSNLGSAAALEEVHARARRLKAPIFVVAVGEHREPISIRITDFQAPGQARPDDKFPVRVALDGQGLPDQEVKVYLDILHPKGEDLALIGAQDQKVLLGPKVTLEPREPVKFKPGEPPHAEVEFQINAAELARAAGRAAEGGAKLELDEGELKLVVRVPKDKREAFIPPEHESDPVTVRVVKRPLRVLLFAHTATRDFQFVRNLFVREVGKGRAELSICVQSLRPGAVMDVSQDRLLTQFPYKMKQEEPGDKPEDRYYNLAQYDLVIAFDPDWTRLQPEQVDLLEKWVGTQAGGLIVLAGHIHTVQTIRPDYRDLLKPLMDLLPVVLDDSRDRDRIRSTTVPYRLKFPGATEDMEFLKLDEDGKELLAGWEEFFTGRQKTEAGAEVSLHRGFYGFYPVKSVKPNATVVALYADPTATLPNGTDPMPYLVTTPYGNGKVVYLGSGETWRLREYREVFYERFWTKLARYTGSGNLTRLSRRGVLVMGATFTAGNYVSVEAQVFGPDLLPQPKTDKPKVELTPPTGVTLPATTFELQPKPGQGQEWNGWFAGRFLLTAPGQYRLDLQSPDTIDTRTFTVKEANPELDNVRPDFGQLYQLASEAGDVLARLDKATQDQLKQRLRPPKLDARETADAKETAAGDVEVPRLFFDLKAAELIPACMLTDSKTQKIRGPVEDLWDAGFPVGGGDPPFKVSTVLIVVVALLSAEWLTRKLLKLA